MQPTESMHCSQCGIDYDLDEIRGLELDETRTGGVLKAKCPGCDGFLIKAISKEEANYWNGKE